MTIRMTRREALGTLAGAGLALGAAPRLLGAEPAATSAPPAPFALPPLPYPVEALEPHLDAETMRLHHGKHHAGYVAKLNAAIAAAPELAGRSVEQLLADLDALPEGLRTAVRDQGGGHANHALLWESLSPRGGGQPAGELGSALRDTFGSFDAFTEAFRTVAGGVFGSGWGWLAFDRRRGLVIESTPNQGSPISAGRVPLLGVDVWEHAYYLKYQNRRAEYLEAFLRVVDWRAVEERFRRARA